MTVIRFRFEKPVDGGRVGTTRYLQFEPTRKHVFEGDPDAVVLPDPFSAETDESGRVDVDLYPSGQGWVWRIFSHGGGYKSLYEYVVVPAPTVAPSGEEVPLDYTDLVRVDPESLDPESEPDPLWWAELEAAKALASDVQEAKDETLVARDQAQGFANDSAASASSAAESAQEAKDVLEDAASNAISAYPDPSNPDLIIISYPTYAAHADGTSIVIPLEVP